MSTLPDQPHPLNSIATLTPPPVWRNEPLTTTRIVSGRKQRFENQAQFWSRFGVAQSRGSRFERGGRIPAPVAVLLWLYLDGRIDDQDLSRARMNIVGAVNELRRQFRAD